jgi:hypothetical protein
MLSQRRRAIHVPCYGATTHDQMERGRSDGAPSPRKPQGRYSAKNDRQHEGNKGLSVCVRRTGDYCPAGVKDVREHENDTINV